MVRLSAPHPAPPRLVATDLDGTVIRTDGTISPRTVTALQAVEAAGAAVVFVTGRPPRWMGEVAAATGHTGLAICSNGALVWDLHHERVVERFELSVEVVQDLVQRLRDALPGIAFGAEAVGGFRHETAYALRYAPEGVVAVDRLEPDEPLVKLLVRAEEGDVDELLAAAREVVGDLAEVVHSSTSGEALLEVSASGVSKATTLARMCEERGIDAAEVVAFGDMPNDLPMLAWAGTAYAMGNAHPDVLAAADRTTLTNDEDGVAVVLERLYR